MAAEPEKVGCWKMEEVACCVDTAVVVAVRLPPSSSNKAPNRLVCRLPEEVWIGLVMVVVAAVPCLAGTLGEGDVENEVTGLVV